MKKRRPERRQWKKRQSSISKTRRVLEQLEVRSMLSAVASFAGGQLSVSDNGDTDADIVGFSSAADNNGVLCPVVNGWNGASQNPEVTMGDLTSVSVTGSLLGDFLDLTNIEMRPSVIRT